ncbi:hypothetical protein [Domibacillus sp.]|uniref:YncE family protein n=1 Tax=Domibacillus sp. TaxID=1969783 RepID=UPI002812414A|nr:hypothetical protein [Domibacillus sp.]
MIDLREHGGPFGAGKYRKGSVINEDDSLEVVTTGGQISFNGPGNISNGANIQGAHLAPDGYLYVITSASSSPYPTYIVKVNPADLAVISYTQIGTWTQGVICAVGDDYYMYFCVRYGGVYKFDLRTLTQVWTYPFGDSTCYGYDLAISGDRVVIGTTGNLAQVSVLVLTKDGGLVWQKEGIQTSNKFVAIGNDGSIYVSASNTSTSSSYPVFFKYDAAGNLIYSNKIAEYGSYPTTRIGVNPYTGKLYTWIQYVIWELDPATGLKMPRVGSKTFGSSSAAVRFIFDKQGHIIMASNATSTGSSATEVVRVRLSDMTMRYNTEGMAGNLLKSITPYGDDKLIVGGLQQMCMMGRLNVFKMK